MSESTDVYKFEERKRYFVDAYDTITRNLIDNRDKNNEDFIQKKIWIAENFKIGTEMLEFQKECKDVLNNTPDSKCYFDIEQLKDIETSQKIFWYLLATQRCEHCFP